MIVQPAEGKFVGLEVQVRKQTSSKDMVTARSQFGYSARQEISASTFPLTLGPRTILDIAIDVVTLPVIDRWGTRLKYLAIHSFLPLAR
jgi:hypothetical protein